MKVKDFILNDQPIKSSTGSFYLKCSVLKKNYVIRLSDHAANPKRTNIIFNWDLALVKPEQMNEKALEYLKTTTKWNFIKRMNHE